MFGYKRLFTHRLDLQRARYLLTLNESLTQWIETTKDQCERILPIVTCCVLHSLTGFVNSLLSKLLLNRIIRSLIRAINIGNQLRSEDTSLARHSPIDPLVNVVSPSSTHIGSWCPKTFPSVLCRENFI